MLGSTNSSKILSVVRASTTEPRLFFLSNYNKQTMKKLFALLSAVAVALPSSATPQSPDYINGGQCAGDRYSKCRYTLEIVNPDEEMVIVPNLDYHGPSRISTVEWCQELTGVFDWQNMITDYELESFDACLHEHT